MTKISADIDKLTQAKTELSAARADLVKTKKNLKKCVNEISGNWEGEAAKSFSNRLNSHIKEIDGYVTTIDQLIKYVDNNTSYMKVLDAWINSIVSRIQNMQASIDSEMNKMITEDAASNGNKN